ncbi:unnamed protein product [Lymnaea stagnalis]|uniref:F-box domain-containing protein n=1 Tax=Lymnaea stagnalis TaxID=6523 RepID=A0AAV2HZZ8_LYMST
MPHPTKKKKTFAPSGPRRPHHPSCAIDYNMVADIRQPPAWSSLPAAVIRKIYQNLTDVDRASMTRVCQSWHEGFCDPVLWRSRVIDFGGCKYHEKFKLEVVMKGHPGQGLTFTTGQNAVLFARQFSRCLKNVDILFHKMSPYSARRILRDFLPFSSSLGDHSRLTSLCFYNLKLKRLNGPRRKKFLNAFLTLTRGQTLKKFGIDATYFDLESGLQLLQCLAETSGATIEILFLKRYFHYPIDQEPRVVTEMQVVFQLTLILLFTSAFSYPRSVLHSV